MWYELGVKHDQSQLKAAEAIATEPSELQGKWRPISDFARTTSCYWQRAAKTAPCVFQSAYDFLMLVRQSIPHAAAVRRFRNINEMIDNSDWDLDQLEEVESRLNKGLAELRWLGKELVVFEQLASEWSRKLVTDWGLTVILKDPVALKNFATVLLRWAEASEHLETKLIDSRKELWGQLGGPLDEARSRACPWYRFGCPSAPGELASLKGMLSYTISGFMAQLAWSACLMAACAPEAPTLPAPSTGDPLPSSCAVSDNGKLISRYYYYKL